MINLNVNNLEMSEINLTIDDIFNDDLDKLEETINKSIFIMDKQIYNMDEKIKEKEKLLKTLIVKAHNTKKWKGVLNDKS